MVSWFNKPWERLESLDILDPQMLQAGEEELAKHKVVVVGIVRDNMLDVYYTKQYIEHTGKFFKDYRVIIFENDSADGTRWLLNNWAKEHDRVKIISKDFGLIKRPSIKFMADSRNHYIDELAKGQKYKDFDMIMMLDMDMGQGWDMRAIFDSFSKIDKWDAVCANGIFRGTRMRDMFAFRNDEFPEVPSQTPDYSTRVLHQGQRNYPVGSDMVPVDSCFGGMAFYKRKAIEGCRYDSIDGDCEHVLFNECVRERNHGRIFMNPSQVIRYFSWDWLLLINKN